MTLAGTAEVGDVYGVNINDQIKVTYSVQSGDTISSIRNKLLNSINSNEDLSEVLVASEGDEQSQITLTAKIAGNAFSAEAIVENVDAGINDNKINISTTTQNLLGADELAAEAENEAVSAAAIITQQINAIKIKSLQADVVVDANNLKLAITKLNDELQPLLFDEDNSTTDVNQNALLIKDKSETAAKAAATAVEKAKAILDLENDEDGSVEAGLRASLAEAQSVAKTNAGEAQSLFVVAQSSRELASDQIKIAAEAAGIDPTGLNEEQIIASLQGKIIAIEGADNLSESASLLLKISKSSLESSTQLLKSADANLVAANKSVENANAQAALAEGVEEDLENLLAQAETAAIAQADDDAEVSAVNAENSFSVAADAAKSVFTDVSTALDAAENAFDGAFKFETTQGGSSVDALSTVKDAVSSLQDQISAVLSKTTITGADGTAVSKGLDNLVSSVDDVINDLNQEFLISLSKELTTKNIITVSIKIIH